MLTVRPILPKIEGGRVQGLLQLIEDGIHLVVAALLVLLAGLLTVGVVHDVIRSIQGPYREETVVLSALDNGLVLFIVAELLHTVRLTIRNQTLDAEPFLVVGLIAGIRKVLIVTAETEKSFRWTSAPLARSSGCGRPRRRKVTDQDPRPGVGDGAGDGERRASWSGK
ncbi:phosphate-starvation-inducible PsiE family protein [Streptomyces sp. NPDC002004]